MTAAHPAGQGRTLRAATVRRVVLWARANQQTRPEDTPWWQDPLIAALHDTAWWGNQVAVLWANGEPHIEWPPNLARAVGACRLLNAATPGSAVLVPVSLILQADIALQFRNYLTHLP